MLSATQLKNNTTFLYNGQPCKVLQYKHTHMGRGQADIKVKIKNLKDGSVLNLNFESSDKFEEAILEKTKMQYLYKDDSGFYFMNPKTFDQILINKNLFDQSQEFLKEGDSIDILFWQDKPLDVDMPTSVVLEIIDCDPGVKGNSATNIFKNATCSNDLKIRVPLFIKKGDKVKIDTRTAEYVRKLKAEN